MLGEGWRPGPAYADWPPLAGDRRTAFYRQPRQVEDLLSPENRIHRMHRFGPNHLETVAQEVVRVADAPGRPAYLLVHLESKAASPQPTALRELAELVRPNREESKEFLRRLAPDGGWSMRPSMRVPTLSLSEAPQPGEPNNLEWDGGDPGVLRLVDLLVLRTDAARVGRPFEAPTQRPTPAHLLAPRLSSVSVLRWSPGGDYKAARLRATWAKAFLLERLQFDEAHTFGPSVSGLVTGARGDWEDLEQDYRGWRTSRAWI